MKLCKIYISAIIFLLSVTQKVFPQSNESTTKADSLLVSGEITELNNNINFLGLFLKSIGALILIAILIFASVFLIKQLYKIKNGKKFNNSFITVLGSSFLAPKKSIYLVEICNRILVLGVTESEINILTELPKEELELDFSAAGKSYPDSLKLKGFPERLTQIFDKIRNGK